MPLTFDQSKILVIPRGERAPEPSKDELEAWRAPAGDAKTYIRFTGGPCDGEYARVDLLTEFVWQKIPRQKTWARYVRNFAGEWKWDGQLASADLMRRKIENRTDVRFDLGV